MPDMAGRQATAHTDLGSTWPDLAFSLPWAASQAPALGLCLGSREGSPLPDPCPGPFGLEETTRLAPPSWRAWPYHLRFSLAVTQVPREGLSCTWAPLALEPAALGTEGAAGTVSSTPVRTRTPCQAEGGGEGWEDAGLHCPEHTGSLHRWGEAASQDLLALAADRRPPLQALSLVSCWAVVTVWLSCSGPSCPPPAPACSGAAVAEPARPSPGPSGSRPCTW